MTTYRPPDNAPKTGIAQQRIQHPFYSLALEKKENGCIRGRANAKEKSESSTRDEIVNQLYSFIVDLSNKKCCISIEIKVCKCNCLRFLKDKDEVCCWAVA